MLLIGLSCLLSYLRVHNVFHVSMLRHYVSDPSHVIPLQPLEISPDLTYEEEPVMILDWKDKVLRNKTIRMVKVLWRNHSVEEATRETEDQMRDMYPSLFYRVSVMYFDVEFLGRNFLREVDCDSPSRTM